MAWFYEIRDARDVVISKSEGFATQEVAHAAGTAEAQRLRHTGNLPGSGLGTVTTGQDSKDPWQ
jgi:hypothetical protein